MKKNNKWLMVLILLISASTVGVSQLKIAAVMQDVAAALGVSTTQAALLMSVFTIAGIVLAIPGAAIQDKMGPKNLLLLLMACLAAGNVLGAVSGSFAVVVVRRILEGISYAMLIMVGIILSVSRGAQAPTLDDPRRAGPRVARPTTGTPPPSPRGRPSSSAGRPPRTS